jgi:hypothetical protein
MTTTFSTVVLIDIAGSDADYHAIVTGSYSPAYRARVPRGEYFVLEPDEAEQFDLETVTVEISGRTLDLLPFLTARQIEAIEREGIAEAGNARAEAREYAAEQRAEARLERDIFDRDD